MIYRNTYHRYSLFIACVLLLSIYFTSYFNMWGDTAYFIEMFILLSAYGWTAIMAYIKAPPTEKKYICVWTTIALLTVLLYSIHLIDQIAFMLWDVRLISGFGSFVFRHSIDPIGYLLVWTPPLYLLVSFVVHSIKRAPASPVVQSIPSKHKAIVTTFLALTWMFFVGIQSIFMAMLLFALGVRPNGELFLTLTLVSFLANILLVPISLLYIGILKQRYPSLRKIFLLQLILFVLHIPLYFYLGNMLQSL